MAWTDASETIVAGTGQVYVAAVGTALPANDSSSLNAAFHGLGYHTEDGVSINKGLEVIEFGAWQSKTAIRRERDTEDFVLTFALQQWNEDTIPFAFGGGSVTDLGSNHYKYTPPDDTSQLDEKSLIVDLDDGSRRMRIVIPRGTINEGVESQFTRNAMAALPISFKALEPSTGGDAWYILSNDSAALATGS